MRQKDSGDKVQAWRFRQADRIEAAILTAASRRGGQIPAMELWDAVEDAAGAEYPKAMIRSRLKSLQRRGIAVATGDPDNDRARVWVIKAS